MFSPDVVEDVFLTIDSTRKGSITNTDLLEFLSSSFSSVKPSDIDCMAVIRQYDSRGNGQWDMADFKRFLLGDPNASPTSSSRQHPIRRLQSQLTRLLEAEITLHADLERDRRALRDVYSINIVDAFLTIKQEAGDFRSRMEMLATPLFSETLARVFKSNWLTMYSNEVEALLFRLDLHDRGQILFADFEAMLRPGQVEVYMSEVYCREMSAACPGCGVRAQRDSACAGCPSVICPVCSLKFKCFFVVDDQDQVAVDSNPYFSEARSPLRPRASSRPSSRASSMPPTPALRPASAGRLSGAFADAATALRAAPESPNAPSPSGRYSSPTTPQGFGRSASSVAFAPSRLADLAGDRPRSSGWVRSKGEREQAAPRLTSPSKPERPLSATQRRSSFWADVTPPSSAYGRTRSPQTAYKTAVRASRADATVVQERTLPYTADNGLEPRALAFDASSPRHFAKASDGVRSPLRSPLRMPATLSQPRWAASPAGLEVYTEADEEDHEDARAVPRPRSSAAMSPTRLGADRSTRLGLVKRKHALKQEANIVLTPPQIDSPMNPLL
eukprot:4195990-Pleurochrysis_carterae.AAC.4